MSFRSTNSLNSNVVHPIAFGFHCPHEFNDAAIRQEPLFNVPKRSPVSVVASFINATIVESRTGFASKIFRHKALKSQTIEFSSIDFDPNQTQPLTSMRIAVGDINQRVAVNLELSSGPKKATINYTFGTRISKSSTSIRFLLNPSNCMGDEAEVKVEYDET